MKLNNKFQAAVTSVSVLALVSSIGIGLASADEKDDKIKQKQQVDQQISQLAEQLSETNQDLSQAYLDLAKTEASIPEAQEKLSNARQALANAQEKDRRIGSKLQSAQAEKDRLQGKGEDVSKAASATDTKREQLALAAYKGGSLPSASSVFVGLEKPADAVDRAKNYQIALNTASAQLGQLKTAAAVNQQGQSRLEAIESDISRLKQESEAAVRERENAESSAEAAKVELDNLFAKQRTQASNLEAKKKEVGESKEQLESESQQLNGDIQRLIEEEKARERERLRKEEEERKAREAEQRRQEEARRKREAEERAKNTRKPIPSSSSAPGRSNPGGSNGGSAGGSSGSSNSSGFIRPVNAPLNSNFGMRFHPILKIWRLHSGVDMAAGCGTPIKAAKAGRVISAGYSGGAGNMVMISHGMSGGQLLTTSYFHQSRIIVSRGQQVSQGQVIGYVGTTGRSTGCHLHFETRLDGNPVNPMRYLG